MAQFSSSIELLIHLKNPNAKGQMMSNHTALEAEVKRGIHQIIVGMERRLLKKGYQNNYSYAVLRDKVTGEVYKEWGKIENNITYGKDKSRYVAKIKLKGNETWKVRYGSFMDNDHEAKAIENLKTAVIDQFGQQIQRFFIETVADQKRLIQYENIGAAIVVTKLNNQPISHITTHKF